jgi:hypothetical protein
VRIEPVQPPSLAGVKVPMVLMMMPPYRVLMMMGSSRPRAAFREYGQGTACYAVPRRTDSSTTGVGTRRSKGTQR